MSARNQECPCGSGKKFKNCCGLKGAKSSAWLLKAVLVVFALLAGWALSGVLRKSGEAPPGKEWSEEHGHWHDAENPHATRPFGAAPPGKVWSEEHGHWHDAPGADAVSADPSSPPPGKVWSEEHGHWHDAPEGNPATPELPPQSPVEFEGAAGD